MKLKLKEKDILAQVKDYLTLHRIFFFRVHQSFGSTKGISDIIAIHPKSFRHMALEIKGPKGKLSWEQVAFLQDVFRSGGIPAVIRSIEDLERILQNEKIADIRPND